MAHNALELRPHPRPPRAARLAAPRPARSQTANRPLLWGLLGFLVGAVFWHLVGFWGFVADIVFHGPSSSGASAEIAGAPPAEALRKTPAPGPRRTVAPGVEPLCVAASRDGRSGLVVQTPCGRGSIGLGSNGSPGRQDKAGTSTAMR